MNGKNICIPGIKQEKWYMKSDDPIGEKSTYGVVYQLCSKSSGDNEDCTHIMKVIKSNFGKGHLEFIKNLEIELQTRCYEHGLCLEIEDEWDCDEGSTGVIVMKMARETLQQFIRDYIYEDKIIKESIISIVKLIRDLHTINIAHRDTHINNFMFTFSGELKFIDLGYSMFLGRTEYLTKKMIDRRISEKIEGIFENYLHKFEHTEFFDDFKNKKSTSDENKNFLLENIELSFDRGTSEKLFETTVSNIIGDYVKFYEGLPEKFEITNTPRVIIKKFSKKMYKSFSKYEKLKIVDDYSDREFNLYSYERNLHETIFNKDIVTFSEFKAAIIQKEVIIIQDMLEELEKIKTYDDDF